MVGTSYMGWRRSVASKTFRSAALMYVDTLLRAMKPKGPGGFDFLCVEGKPVLSDINTGRLNHAHIPKLFQEMYAPGQSLFCWRFKPPLELDVQAT